MTDVGDAEKVKQLEVKLREARDRVRLAQEKLDEAVEQLVPVAVGDKHFVSDALERAFMELQAAQTCVRDLRSLLSGQA